MTNEHGYCPKCNVDLDSDSIWEYFFKQTGSETDADRIADHYGADRKHGKFGRAIALYDREQDRTAYWKCPDCEHVWERT